MQNIGTLYIVILFFLGLGLAGGFLLYFFTLNHGLNYFEF
jgi:hypothetical protein